jgi:triosephosphate isomerase
MTPTNHLRALFCTAVRVLLGVVFVFSSFVKAIDPIGFSYKIGEYLKAAHLSFPSWIDIPVVASVAIISVEFVMGVYLVLGIRRKFCAIVTLFMVVAFTLVSVLQAVFHPVADCGCFGDFLVLTDLQSLLKNVVLLVLAIVFYNNRRKTVLFVPVGWHWLLSLYSCVFILLFSLRSLYGLPLIDFRPYSVGTNLREAVFPEHIEDDYTPLDFFVTDTTGNDCTAKILMDKQAVLLVVCPRLDEADTSLTESLNVINDWCVDRGYSMYCLTSSPSAEMQKWSDDNDIQYPILEADYTMLRTVIRSNPGLVLLHDGIIRNKWSSNDLPQIEDDNMPVEQLETTAKEKEATLLRILLWYLLPMAVVILLAHIVDILRKRSAQKKTKHLMSNPNTNKQMRKKIVAGNWKMNMTLQEGVALAKELNEVLSADKPNCGVIICTPFIHLATIAPMLDTNIIKLGAENCADKEKGAYTGEVSAAMVKSTGAEYVILGHSERRAYYGETPEILKEKVNLALANGLKVIFCIGEVLEDREAGKQNEVVAAQLAGSLYDLTPEQFSNIVLAYEPVWAIGTGKTATADQAQEMHAFIRSEIAKQFGAEVAENTTIQYGGSCKPGNAKELFAKPDVDGGLIGGAALKAVDFKGIIDAWKA